MESPSRLSSLVVEKVRDEHADKFQNLVNDAVEKGAEIIGRESFGYLGEDAVDQFFSSNSYCKYKPYKETDAKEAFGPIIPIMRFSSEKEVIKLANDSNYGLGCAVFSGNQKRSIQ